MAYMDDDEPVFCTGCGQTTRIRCPHVPHRGQATAPGAARRAQMAGIREYRSAGRQVIAPAATPGRWVPASSASPGECRSCQSPNDTRNLFCGSCGTELGS